MNIGEVAIAVLCGLLLATGHIVLPLFLFAAVVYGNAP